MTRAAISTNPTVAAIASRLIAQGRRRHNQGLLGRSPDAAVGRAEEIEHDRRDVPVGDPVQVDLSEIAADTARDLREEARRHGAWLRS
jgi:hypothetical protein